MADEIVAKIDARDEPTTGALDVSNGPDTSAQSIKAGILADMGDEPLIKRKPGRPAKVELTADIDADGPPEPLADEPEEASDEESTTEAKEGDDDVDDTTELDARLRDLSESYGVPLSDIEDCESVAEAQRFIARVNAIFAREAQYEPERNGNAGRQPAPAAEAVQTKAAKALELDLDKYDDDEPIKNDLKKLADALKERDEKIERLEQADQRRRETDFQRVQAQISQQFSDEILRASPELFGTPEKQSREQRKNFLAAFDQADVILRGSLARGKAPATVREVAEMAVNAKFAKELGQKQILAKRASVQQREKRRSVGAPARNARPASAGSQSAEVYKGDMKDDPDLLGTVRSMMARGRE